MRKKDSLSIDSYTRAHKLYIEIGDQRRGAKCEQDLADIHCSRGDHVQAIEHFARALELYSDIGDRPGVAECQRLMGDIHRVRNEYDQAMERLVQALEVFSEIGDHIGMARCQHSLGTIHCARDEYEQAVETLVQAERVFSEMGQDYRVHATDCLQSLGNLHRVHEEYDAAREELGRALELAAVTGDRHEIAWSRVYMGLLEHDQRRFADAVQSVEAARSLFTEIQEEFGIKYCLDLLTRISKDMADDEGLGDSHVVLSDDLATLG